MKNIILMLSLISLNVYADDTNKLCTDSPDVLACEQVQGLDSSGLPQYQDDTDGFFDFLSNPINEIANSASDFIFPNFPQPSCTYAIHKTFLGHSFDLDPCVALQPLRSVLQWVFGFLSAFMCFRIIFVTQ